MPSISKYQGLGASQGPAAVAVDALDNLSLVKQNAAADVFDPATVTYYDIAALDAIRVATPGNIWYPRGRTLSKFRFFVDKDNGTANVYMVCWDTTRAVGSGYLLFKAALTGDLMHHGVHPITGAAENWFECSVVPTEELTYGKVWANTYHCQYQVDPMAAQFGVPYVLDFVTTTETIIVASS